MSRHIVLGDVHLGKGVRLGKQIGLMNSRVQDQEDLLDWVLQQAKKHSVDTIIITGDIYEDANPHPLYIKIFTVFLKKGEKSNIDIHVLKGNHDIMRVGSNTVSALDIVPVIELPNATVHSNVTTVHFNGVSVTMVPYRDRGMYDEAVNTDALQLLHNEFKDEYKTIPKGNIRVLIGHLALVGSIWVGDEIDDSVNELFCDEDMFRNWDYVWMGHIHNPQVIKTDPGLHLAHVGSMDVSDFGKQETDIPKIIILIDTDTEGFFTEIKLPTRKLKVFKLKVPDDKDTTDFVINQAFLADKEDTFEDAIVKIDITIEGNNADKTNRAKVQKYFNEKLKVHNIAGFSESRSIAIEEAEVSDLFDNNMSTMAAVKTYADSQDEMTEEERSEFIAFSKECEEAREELLAKRK